MSARTSFSEELNHRARLGEACVTLELALDGAERPIVSSKFGPDSAVFLHFVTRRLPGIPVVRVETGYDTRETRHFVEQLRDRLDLNLRIYRPTEHVIVNPPALDDAAHAEFVEAVKLEPFRRAMLDLEADVWLSSIRRYQSDHRRSEPAFRMLESNVLKVSPLLGWTADTVARYAREHDLPVGPEVFDPTKGEPFRECGLHVAIGG